MSATMKGTALTDGALSEEAMASSDKVLSEGRFGHLRGLQQFPTPEKAANLAHIVIGDAVGVLDITAGNGAFLKSVNPTRSFGVEIDPDQIKGAEGGYQAIQGDIQEVYALLRTACPQWSAIVCNPPFGLGWSDPLFSNGKQMSSAKLALLYTESLLDDDGQFVFICGENQWLRQLRHLDEAQGVYAVIRVPDMYPNTKQPVVMAFGIARALRSAASQGYTEREVPLEMLDLIAPWIAEARDAAENNYNQVARYENYHSLEEKRNAFEAIKVETRRRSEKRLKSDREFDCWREGGKIKFLPSAYASLTFKKRRDHHGLSGLNNQSVNYFVTNERHWHKLIAYANEGIIRIEPALQKQIDQMVIRAREIVKPLYPIKPQQRLGFLPDHDSLVCRKTDEEKGFVKGESYRLNTDVVARESFETRWVESKKKAGELVEKKFLITQQAMQVSIGHHTFWDSGAEASEQIAWLVEHFEMPDVGDSKTNYPDKIEALEEGLQTILNEFETNSREWEKTNPTATPYTHRRFQREDIARLLFKESGLLSWEQGLGKTLGGLLFHKGAVELLKAQDACLIVTTKDLLDQWQREIKRFYGTEAILIRSHGHAREVAKHLKLGGKGLYITYYEAMSQVGTRGKQQLLPVQVVKEITVKEKVKWTDRRATFIYVDDDGNPTNERYKPDGSMGKQKTLGNKDNFYTYPQAEYTNERGYGVTCRQYKDEAGNAVFDAEGKPIKVHVGWVYAQYEDRIKQITTKEICPECHADTKAGWNGVYCEAEDDQGQKCGYAHYAVRVKPIAAQLTTAFRKGTIILDEIQMIQGNFAKRSFAIRGMRAKHKLGMTGTPIKNFISQAFWLLWWSLGNGSQRFGYMYQGGYSKFETDFSVIEYGLDKQGRKVSRAAAPGVSNLSVLWRLLCPSIIRRRKEETGEPLVEKYYHDVRVPLGICQTTFLAQWMKNFPKFFAEKFPDAPVVKAGMHEILAPMLGLNWKLEYGCTLPEGDPDREWLELDEITNWTPANLKALEYAMALVAQGRKVLIGSNLIPTSKWLADNLNTKGVKAIHILDESGAATVDAEKRAKHVYNFQVGDDVQVFCAGIKAMRLGHNLDRADAVILHGLDWSYDEMDQFVNRVHRLTSQNPIDIYVILPSLAAQNTITTRKWKILASKGEAADLALDGRLIQKHEAEVERSEIIRQLVEQGLHVTDEAVDETSVFEAWEGMPHIEQFPAEGILPERPRLTDEPVTEEGKAAAEAIGEMLRSAQLAFDKAAREKRQAEIEAARQAEAEAKALSAQDVPEEVEEIVDDEFVLTDEEIAAFLGNEQVALATIETRPVPWASQGLVMWQTGPEATASEPHDEDAPAIAEPVELPAPAGTQEAAEATPVVVLDEAKPNDGSPMTPVDEPEQESQTTVMAPAPALDYMGQIRQAAELHELGVLTDIEFAEAKAALIAGMKAAA